MSGRSLAGASLAIGAVCAVLAPAAEAAISCTYKEAGAPGPAGNVLSVKASAIEIDVAAITRDGPEIVVSDDRKGKAVACAGAKPTVGNLDSVEFAGESNTALVLDLRNGPLGPGATAEPDGTSEIEVEATWPDYGTFVINAGDEPTPYSLGMAAGAAAIDLEAPPGEPAEVDVALVKAFSIIARGGGGGDSIDARGGAGFFTPLRLFTVFEGGSGSDTLVGGAKASILSGERGDDRLVGMGRHDDLDGGPGHDVLIGGGGGDTIAAADGVRDRVRCGPGRDRVEADPKDRLRGCERVLRFG